LFELEDIGSSLVVLVLLLGKSSERREDLIGNSNFGTEVVVDQILNQILSNETVSSKNDDSGFGHFEAEEETRQAEKFKDPK